MDWIQKPNQLFKVNSFELIGSGGFGRVYKHKYDLDNKMYAIKKIAITQSSASTALKEVRILANVNHDNIIRYMTSWIEESINNDHNTTYYLCIKMEFCHSTLSTYLQERSDFVFNYKYIKQILNGVKYLHDLRIIHRDLKPDNILINNNNIIKITDFSLAKTELYQDTMHSSYNGAFLYTSPEQYDGYMHGFDSDIYSLGIIIFEMYHIFKTEMEKIENILKLKKQLKTSSYIHNYDFILKMVGPQLERPSIHEVMKIFLPTFEETSFILCRDIIWAIVLNVLSIKNP
jgi:serine/threonine protein kinase